MFSPADFSDIAQGGSAIAVAAAAWFGVLTWKTQAVGKRKVEVAEEALTALNQIAEKFSVFRVSFKTVDPQLEESLSKLGANSIPGRHEITLQYEIQKWLKPHFDRINEVRPLAQTYFGDDALVPFLTLNTAISSLQTSAMSLDSDELDRDSFRAEMNNLFQGGNQKTECTVLLSRLSKEADAIFGSYLRQR